ncbi:hypothetical protein CXB77_02020 [Chromatium okenii]|uniref:Uncharacterized protein n=1 Tax=Chromatium okenii TaxID=61644 RepID=A0A2S7XUZ8_9GAMM|nr:hypothetical protein CXB77_02020 [Chromatium okenii]
MPKSKSDIDPPVNSILEESSLTVAVVSSPTNNLLPLMKVTFFEVNCPRLTLPNVNDFPA